MSIKRWNCSWCIDRAMLFETLWLFYFSMCCLSGLGFVFIDRDFWRGRFGIKRCTNVLFVGDSLPQNDHFFIISSPSCHSNPV